MSDRTPAGGLRSLVAIATLAALALAACSASSGASPKAGASGSAGASHKADASGSAGAAITLEGPTWQLTDYVGPAGNVLPVPKEVAATATFSNGQVSGDNGCNSYHGTYTVTGSVLAISGVASTQKACGPIPTAVETAFNAALPKVASYSISGDTLELKTAEGKVGMRFKVAQSPSLTGTRWVAIGINNGKGGVASAVAGSTVTALFAPDGMVAGSGGCNDYSGSYTVSGATLTFGPLASTKKACADAAVSDQEAAYFAALEKVKTFAFSGGRLQLRDAGGALQVDYTSTP